MEANNPIKKAPAFAVGFVSGALCAWAAYTVLEKALSPNVSKVSRKCENAFKVLEKRLQGSQSSMAS